MTRSRAAGARGRASALSATHLVFDARRPSEPEDRMRAAWDDALTTGGLAAELADGLRRSRRASTGARLVESAPRRVSHDACSARIGVATTCSAGGSFLVLPRDDIGREVLALGRRRRAALRGAHRGRDRRMRHASRDHLPPTRRDAAHLRNSGRAKSAACRATTSAMRSCACSTPFATSSRVKIGYAYKVEALAQVTAIESPVRGS